MKMKMTKAERSWVLYDWANSVYATIMMAAVFPIFFASVCATNGQVGDFWWGIGTAIATATVAIMAPFIGAIADYKGYKKKLLAFFLGLGLVFTLLSAFTDYWQLMLVGYIISHIGFSGSVLAYDSFLTDVTVPERMDAISSWGYAMGYIGGSTIPFIMSIVLITFGENFGVNATLAVKLSLVITVLWWGIFSIPILKNVQQKYGSTLPKNNFIKHTFVAVVQTAKDMFSNKGILFFILAYFFYIDGVNTVINMATSYGATLGLDSVKMILALLVTQLVAMPCSILFGKLSSKYGSLRMITIAIFIYLFICVMGFYMGFGMEEGFLTISQAEKIFWGVAVVVGTVQGGIQAISRSYFGKIVPPDRSGEYFGFFDIFGKFAAVLGPVLYAATRGFTGRSSYSILSLIFLFVVALIILALGKKHLQQAK
ncbi:MAG: MFS transporter [Clostridia bacterium]